MKALLISLFLLLSCNKEDPSAHIKCLNNFVQIQTALRANNFNIKESLKELDKINLMCFESKAKYVLDKKSLILMDCRVHSNRLILINLKNGEIFRVKIDPSTNNTSTIK